MLFAFTPESCSGSARNPVRLHPGFPFAFSRNPQSIRERFAQDKLTPDSRRGRDEIEAWICNCFSRSYPVVAGIDATWGSQAINPVPKEPNPRVPAFLLLAVC